MRMVTLTKQTTKDILENLLKRSPGQYGSYEAAVKEILEKVREEGDRALFAYTKKFDRAEITEQNVQVTEEEIREAYEAVNPDLVDVIRKSLVNIRSYHEKQKQNSWFTSSEDGTLPLLWRQMRPEQMKFTRREALRQSELLPMEHRVFQR